MARLILTEAGEDVEVGGEVTVFGTTSPGEEITVLHGDITFDASFNNGGDTIRLPDLASAWTIRILGSVVIIASDTATVRIPIGVTGVQVAFDDVSRTLVFDVATATSKLGNQVITNTESGVFPPHIENQLVGTQGADTINGTGADDGIEGVGGNDTINGLGGNDYIRGGDGDDTLTGGLGDDEIYGGAGNDRIIDNEGDYALLDGGSGNDHISVNNPDITSLTLSAGEGDDIIELTVGEVGVAYVSTGPGTDRVVIDSDGMEVSVLLGTGRDEVVLPAGALNTGNFGLVILQEFELGAAGDKVELASALSSYLQNYSAGSNPFATGHLRLTDVFGNAYLQVDRDGPDGSGQFKDLINFAGVDKDALTAANFGGFDPKASTATSPAMVSLASAALPEVVMLQPESVSHDLAYEAEVRLHHLSHAEGYLLVA